MSSGTYSLKLTPKDSFFFWETFHGNFIFRHRTKYIFQIYFFVTPLLLYLQVLPYKIVKNFKVIFYMQTWAPMSLSWGISSAIYIHKTRTLTMFIKNSLKLHSVACHLLKEKFHVALFQVSIIHPKKYYSRIHYFSMRFINSIEK